MSTALILAAVATVNLLTSCATTYHTSGFTETQLAPDVFRVVFRGNAYTSRERTQDLAMLRAAELALQHGFTYFAVVDERSLTSTHSVTSPGYAMTTGTSYLYGNQATDSGHTTYTGGGTQTFYKPGTGLVVQFFKTKPPGMFAFDAAFLRQSIKQKYRIQ